MPEGRALVYCAGGGIGDSLIASLVGRALRQKYATVDALTLPGHCEALRHCADLDEVLVDAGGDEKSLAAMLAARGYAACVVTWATARTAKVPFLARIPVRVGQARRLYSRQFTKRVQVRSERGDARSHWSDIQLDYARALGCDLPRGERIPSFRVSGDDERECAEVLRSLDFAGAPLGMASADGAASAGGISGEGAYVVVHSTNAIAAQRGMWPTQGWSELVRALYDALRVPILLTGTKADASILDSIRRPFEMTSSDFPRVASLAGKLRIGGFGALAQGAKVVIGMGTGTLHVAGAVGARTVALFPMQSDFPERWRPLGECVRVIRASYPCHRGDTKEHCPDYACIANLPVEAIVTTVRELV